jgi:hypothetical protein
LTTFAASLDPVFLSIQYTELLFVGLSQDLRFEDHLDYLSPPFSLTEELEEQCQEEMEEAEMEFGKGNESVKLSSDLHLLESSQVLGPDQSLRTGKFI